MYVVAGMGLLLCDIYTPTGSTKLNPIGSRWWSLLLKFKGKVMKNSEKAKKIGKAHNIKIIHDAAHSFGAVYKGLHCGNLADATMFSFDPVKSITCLDGGALIVKTEEEVEKLHQMRLVGMGQPAAVMYGNQRAWTYNVEQLGFRYHMSNMHAAIGLAQLSKFDEIVESRRHACSFYDSQLKDVVELKVPLADYSFVVPFLYYIRVPKGKRKDFIDWMKLEGVDLGIHWQPGHWFELFKNCKSGDLSVTEKIAYEIVSLPLHSKMNLSDLEKITRKIREFFNYA